MVLPALWPEHSPAWDEVVRSLPADLSPAGLDAYQFVFESPRIKPGAEFAAYARAILSARPAADRSVAGFHRTHLPGFPLRFKGDQRKDLARRSAAPQAGASVRISLTCKSRACDRWDLPARYVSGYLRTYPPPGRPRLIGADASHAWVSVYCPGTGWLDVDPTNNLIPSEGHVTLAWGRDYGDVSPVRGVILGGRDHKLDVGVEMEPLD